MFLQICCPNDGVRFIPNPKRLCGTDEWEECIAPYYYGDEYNENEYPEKDYGDSEKESADEDYDNFFDTCQEKLDCKVPGPDLHGIFTYSFDANCTEGTSCKNSQTCGVKGKKNDTLYLLPTILL